MISDETSLQAALGAPRERTRLVGLCARLTGDRDAAEDLAQQTLLEAWRHRDFLRRPDAFRSWLAGIAVNVCRRWQRRTAVESMRTAPLSRAEHVAGGVNLEGALERDELSALLARAMKHLTPGERQVLVARYVEDTPLAEIAAWGGWTANTAAARLHRSREALRHVLTTRLRAEAVEFGLIAPAATGWQQTRVWCFRCGLERLQGRFTAHDVAAGDDGAGFAVRCPRCDTGAGDVAFSSAHSFMDAARVLGPVNGYKPALRRIIAWWDVRIQRGLREGVWECWRCAGAMTRLSAAPADAHNAPFARRAQFRCGRCAADFGIPVSGLMFHSGACQRFWQRHPRMRVAPERGVVHAGRPALVARYEDVAGAAFLECLYTADTFEALQTWGDAPTDSAA